MSIENRNARATKEALNQYEKRITSMEELVDILERRVMTQANELAQMRATLGAAIALTRGTGTTA